MKTREYLKNGAFNVWITESDITVPLKARRYSKKVHRHHWTVGKLIYVLWALKVRMPQ